MRAIAASLLLFALLSVPVTAAGDLEEGFVNPPASAKPHTWWHWMNGNVTAEGITADLEAMARVGVGGAQIFNVDYGVPAGPVRFMSDEWRRLIVHSAREAQRLGLELCIHNCAGWSSSGGPWVAPEHAMQTVVTSEVQVTGPGRVELALRRPSSRHGHYRDIAVLAFPTPGGAAERDTFRIPGIRHKAAFAPSQTRGADVAVPEPPDELTVRPGAIRDVTDSLQPDGTLTWDVPDGQWTLLRLGHTPTGRNNHPAPPEGRGLEVDKMSREAMDSFFAGMMQTVLDDCGALAGTILNNALIDSYEVGYQNWTPRFRQEFARRRGYDPLPWLVALTGRAVGSIEQTERFLWDFRRTIAELHRDNYFAYFADLCHERGLLASVEPYGNGLFDQLAAGAPFDVPMGEFWVGSTWTGTVKLAASVAHTNGRSLVGAESFTANWDSGKWQNDPYALKALGDRMFCAGVNRLIFHRYAHQPWTDRVPGMTMGPWGFHFERTNTWWEPGAAWLKYLARCQYMLQQGRFVADICCYAGEDAPVGLNAGPPWPPAGYDYDGISREQLMGDLTVRDGRLELPSGMSYRVLVLPVTDAMTPEVARKVRDLVEAGGTVVGPRPTRSPSLSAYPRCDEEVRELVAPAWENRLGSGRVFEESALGQAIDHLDLTPDFTYSGDRRAELLYIHRVTEDADIYFVSNQANAARHVTCSFRVMGKRPEIWRPDTGYVGPAPVFRQSEGRTEVPLLLGPSGSAFVVFREPLDAAEHVVRLSHDDGSATGLHASSPAQFEVRRAVYGILDDPDRRVDVTEQVRDRVRNGVLLVQADNRLAGDPAPMVVKAMRIDYTLDGRDGTVTVREHETVMLPEGAQLLPAAEPQLDSRGRPQLLAWQGGRYEAETSTGRLLQVEVPTPHEPVDVTGPWTVSFPPNLGAPAGVTLGELISWTDHDDPGIRYFSGTATYRTRVEVPPALLAANGRVRLDLGRVRNLARVRLNGDDLGVLWKPPFALDVTDSLRPRANELVVEVTNLWPNRLIGDERLPDDAEWAPFGEQGVHLTRWPDWLVEGRPRPETGRVAFTTWKHWHADDELLESGLLGPVVLRQAVLVPLYTQP